MVCDAIQQGADKFEVLRTMLVCVVEARDVVHKNLHDTLHWLLIAMGC